jgi:hypothetical protein
MFAGLIQHANKLKFLLNANSTAILTGMGVSGTVATAYLTGRASFRAAHIIRNEEVLYEVNTENDGNSIGVERFHHVSTSDKVKLVWKLYIPPVGVGLGTISSIVMANRSLPRRLQL